MLKNNSIPTDGSGRLLITDVSIHNGIISESDEYALICHADKLLNVEPRISPGTGDWYLDPNVSETPANIVSGQRIITEDNRGWTRTRNSLTLPHRLVRLKRVSETAVEGKFICNISGDINNIKFLLLLYPSECEMCEVQC